MALVLAPTRELAQQIQDVVRTFNAVRCVCLFGGQSRNVQMEQLMNWRPPFIIATPGRLNDFIDSNIINLKDVDYFVMDEADRMLDMGFEPQIRQIIQNIPSEKRQTLMWSATWPEEVRSLAEEFLRNYIQVNVGSLDLFANHSIKQIIKVCEYMDKGKILFEILKDLNGERTLIFAQTKSTVDFLTHSIRNRGWSAVGTHGGKTQRQRDLAIQSNKVFFYFIIDNYNFYF